MIARTCASLVVGLALSGVAHADSVTRHAVIVGANDGGSLLETLQYAENDARRMASILKDLGGFESHNVHVMLGPTADELATTLTEVAAITGEATEDGEALFVFYYSGHADAVGLKLAGEHFEYGDLKAAIRDVPADVHLGILDACRSGAITQVKGASVSTSFLDEDTLATTGEAWIAASSADEDAQESSLIQGSFFTYYLVSGMRGAADVDDGWVTLNEAYQYASDRTVARTAGTDGGIQHPFYDYNLEGHGDLKLTEVRKATARITLPAGESSEIAVLRLPEKTPMAEVAKISQHEVQLALEPGTYLLKRRLEDGTLEEVTVSLSEGTDLVVDRWGEADEEPIARKGVTETPNAVEIDDEGLRVNIDIPWKLPKDPGDLKLPKMNFRKSPAIAGVASALLPGLGQVYDGRPGDGALFFLGVLACSGPGWLMPGNNENGLTLGPNPLALMGTALWAWSVTDAAWSVRRRETVRPYRGVTLSLTTGWESNYKDPWSTGFSLDMHPVKGLSVGADRTGFMVREDREQMEFRTGVRATVGPELERVRPAIVVAAGGRYFYRHEVQQDGEETDDDSGPLPDGGMDAPNLVLPYYAIGAQSRFYVTPRYFLELDGRAEWSDDSVYAVLGGGLGFHLGGRR